MRDRCQAAVVNVGSLSGGRVIEKLRRPARCPPVWLVPRIREGRTAALADAAELGQASLAATHFRAAIGESRLFACRGAIGEKDRKRSRRRDESLSQT